MSEESHRSGYKIGYARVSTLDQNSALQQDALKEAGCEKIFIEQMSGAVSDRPALARGRGNSHIGILPLMPTDRAEPWPPSGRRCRNLR